jgi:predicted Na+-dependent transporter
MKKNIFTILLPVGIALGFILPYFALELSRWTFVFLSIMMLLNFLKIEIPLKEIIQFELSDLYTIFFAFFFMPSLFVILGHLLNLPSPLTIGFFLTNLAPFAIIAPQFLVDDEDKKRALKLVLLSTFLFPFYFIILFYFFYSKSVRLNSLALFQDALLLIFVPFVISQILKRWKDSKIMSHYLLPIVPHLNISIIGLLCFIYTGSTYLKNNIFNLSSRDIAWAITLAFLQDFGSYFMAQLAGLKDYQRVSIGAKNVALTGIFATIFFPKSILAIVLVLGVHFLMFNYFYLRLDSVKRN